MAATASSNCSGFFNLRSSTPAEAESRPVRRSSAAGNGSAPAAGCFKLDGVVVWLVNSVSAAFFSSLDRCSCIRIATVEDDGDDANELPLILNDANSGQMVDGASASAASVVRRTKHRKEREKKTKLGAERLY